MMRNLVHRKAFTVLIALFAFFALNLSVSHAISISKASFPHGKAKHRTLDCAKCHKVSIEKPDVKYFPGHNACSSCHNFGEQALNHADSFCGICHNGTPTSVQQPALFAFPKRTVPTDFGYQFSHVSHLKTLPVNAALKEPFAGGQNPICTNCHHMTPTKVDYTSDFSHGACFTCHGQTPVAAPAFNECAKCHLVDGEHFVSLIDSVKNFKHSEHSIDIRSKKKVELANYRKPDFLCFDCHNNVATSTSLPAIHVPTEQTCNTCHNGRIGLPDPLAMEIITSLKSRS